MVTLRTAYYGCDAELALDSKRPFGYNVNHGGKPRAGVMEWQT